MEKSRIRNTDIYLKANVKDVQAAEEAASP
jgi:hypothetical protein